MEMVTEVWSQNRSGAQDSLVFYDLLLGRCVVYIIKNHEPAFHLVYLCSYLFPLSGHFRSERCGDWEGVVRCCRRCAHGRNRKVVTVVSSLKMETCLFPSVSFSLVWSSRSCRLISRPRLRQRKPHLTRPPHLTCFQFLKEETEEGASLLARL